MTTRRCKFCGQEFKVNKRTVQYCSRECYDAYYKKQLADLKIKRKQKRMIEVFITCAICGKEMKKNSPTHLYCSTECASKARIQKYLERKQFGYTDFTPKASNLKSKNYTIVTCNMCEKPFRSWDKTKNRRCPACQSQIDENFTGVDTTFLEGGQ